MSTPARAEDLDYRSVPDADVEAFYRLTSYAFNPTEAFDPDDVETDGPQAVVDSRGMYDGDELVTTGGHIWFDLRVRGAWREAVGLTAVATPPKYRRRGYVRRLLADSLAEYRERGLALSTLWAFSHPFYRKFGWWTFSRYARTEFEPEALAFLDDPGGALVDLDPDDWEALDAVYAARNDRPFAMDRDEDWWRHRVFRGWQRDPPVAGWERDGELAGYLVYTVRDGDEGDRMDVSELAYRDPEALRATLRYCRLHDSQVETVRLQGPPREARRLQELTRTPRDFEVQVRFSPMVRVVDVRALPGLVADAATDGASGGEASLVLEVEDPIADWNDGRFRLSPERCEPTDAEPDATVDVATLSAVVSGAVPAERAAWVGDLDASEAAVAALDALFPPTEEPFLREFF